MRAANLMSKEYITHTVLAHRCMFDDSSFQKWKEAMESSNLYLTSLFPGLYLFLQVKLPLNVDIVKHWHYLVIGWGKKNYYAFTSKFF